MQETLHRKKEIIKILLATDNTFLLILSTVEDIPAYWRQFLLKILAMVKQFLQFRTPTWYYKN